MAEGTIWGSGPCDRCGRDTGCTCPPCPCMWCRHARGEPLTELERAEIGRRARQAEGEALRDSAKRMRAKIAAAVARRKGGG